MRKSWGYKVNEHGRGCESTRAGGKSQISKRVWPQKHEQGVASISGEKALCQLCEARRNIWHEHKNKQ